MFTKIDKKNFLKIIIIAALLTFPISHLYLENQKINSNEIIFLDVGQGDGIFIKNAEGKIGVIDTGKNLSGLMATDKYLSYFKNELEFLIITHTDADHSDGLEEFLKRLNPKYLFISTEYKLRNIKDTKVIKSNLDSDFNFGEFRFDFIWPENFAQKDLEDNDSSIGLIISYKNIDVFAAGDLSSEYELEAFENRSYAQSIEILKLSHHGSNTSSNEEFLNILKPKIAIISAGKDNSYGHPHGEILENLNKLSIPYLRTDLDGDIQFIFEEDSYRVNY